MKKKTKKNNTKEDMLSQIEEKFKRHTGVLMEQMRHEVKTVAEGHSTLVRKLEEHDKRFDKVDSRLGNVESMLGKVESEQGSVKSELHSVKMAVMDNSQRLDRVEKKLDENLDNHEKRITKLEEKVHV